MARIATLRSKALHLAVILGSLTGGLAQAAPAEVVPTPAGTNDGYIVVAHVDSDDFALSDKVCPLGTVLTSHFNSDTDCQDGDGKALPMVSVQNVLDAKYGPGHARAVGFSPWGPFYNRTIVYVRFTAPAH